MIQAIMLNAKHDPCASLPLSVQELSGCLSFHQLHQSRKMGEPQNCPKLVILKSHTHGLGVSI